MEGGKRRNKLRTKGRKAIKGRLMRRRIRGDDDDDDGDDLPL